MREIFFFLERFKCVSLFLCASVFFFLPPFLTFSLCDDWLSQRPTAKIYVKCVESLKSLKCLAGIVLNHFRSVRNIYHHYRYYPPPPTIPAFTTFYPSWFTRSLYTVTTHIIMQHCQMRNWLNTSRLNQLTSFPNFLIRYNLDVLHRITSFFVVEFAKGIFLSYFLMSLLLLLFLMLLFFVLLIC